jgi:hypothetical protein
MYHISLIRNVTMNPFPYNEYILIKIIKIDQLVKNPIFYLH